MKSDICGITFDKDNIYASIRNGSVAVINRKTFENNIYKIFDYSLWNLESYNDNLISGTTNGKLLIIDKNDMVIKNSIDIGKQNIGTIIIDKNSVYTAGQDKKLSKIDLKELKCKALRRNAHIRMFDCIGIYGNTVITISYPSSEIGFWDKETLDLIKTIKIPLSLTGRTFIENDCLYISSRNIQGIILFHL